MQYSPKQIVDQTLFGTQFPFIRIASPSLTLTFLAIMITMTIPECTLICMIISVHFIHIYFLKLICISNLGSFTCASAPIFDHLSLSKASFSSTFALYSDAFLFESSLQYISNSPKSINPKIIKMGFLSKKKTAMP